VKRNTKRVVGGLILAAGSVGALGALLIKRSGKQKRSTLEDVWARPGMPVTFRAELMPGQNRSSRTFRVKELLPSGRVILHDTGGEHTETEFEQIRRVS
jgi:hypothetical protein